MSQVGPTNCLAITERAFKTNTRSRWPAPVGMAVHFEMEVVVRQPCEICCW